MNKYSLSGKVYLDNAATALKDAKLMKMYLNYQEMYPFNPMSSHPLLADHSRVLDNTREKILAHFNLNIEEYNIVFTSGSTESLGIILQGMFMSSTGRRKIISSSLEHKAVLNNLEYLESIGADVEYVDNDNNGVLDLNQLSELVDDTCLYVSIMYVNNETGEINDLETISDICKDHDVPFICDTTQAIGKHPFKSNLVDAFVGSAHKLGGPFGIGFLVYKKDLNPISVLKGGGQELSLRPGTHNLPGILTLAECLRDVAPPEPSYKNMVFKELGLDKNQRIGRVGSDFIYAFKVEDIDKFISKNKNYVVGRGSACNSGLVQESHVYKSLGLDRNVVRISF